MRLRTWAAIVAMLGVLLHASALVRHQGLVLDAQQLEQALAHGGAICLAGEGRGSQPTHLPATPTPSDAQSGCPVCCGHGPAFVLAAPDDLRMPVRFAAMARWSEPERVSPALRHAVCPPSRGPPASAVSA